MHGTWRRWATLKVYAWIGLCVFLGALFIDRQREKEELERGSYVLISCVTSDHVTSQGRFVF